MATTPKKQEAKRLRTFLIDEFGPRWRELDSVVLLKNRRVACRIDVGQYDAAVLSFLDGQDGYHSFELYSHQQKKPASSGLGFSDKVLATFIVIFAAVGAFVTFATVAGALN